MLGESEQNSAEIIGRGVGDQRAWGFDRFRNDIAVHTTFDGSRFDPGAADVKEEVGSIDHVDTGVW